MTHVNASGTSARGLSLTEHAPGPHIVAMDNRGTQHQEAYYLFFVGSLGMALNLLVMTMIFVRRPLRRMTSTFLAHAAFLNLVKAAFCIPFGLNLLSNADASKENQPQDCKLQGATFIVIVTSSAVNMVAMVCTEAYTFGEVNVGGNSRGTTCCVLFGVMVVYITSVILHLGPTLIGGDIVYNPAIGSCAFRLGKKTGYIANVMWIVIITMSFVGVGHFLKKLYKEIQQNSPNRVSMLVRHSLTIMDGDSGGGKPSNRSVHEMVQDALHRAKIFVITATAFVLCWYPLFLLILVDEGFNVSPKVYQAFSFIAWTQALVEPVILIFFDRNLNLLARYMYCDRDTLDATQIAYLMAQSRQRDEDAAASTSVELMMGDLATANDAIPLTPMSRDSNPHAFMPLEQQGACRHCSPTHSSVSDTTPLYSTLSRGGPRSQTGSPQQSSSPAPHTALPRADPAGLGDSSFERPFKPVRGSSDTRRRNELHEEDIQC